jgi:hypothetical protein
MKIRLPLCLSVVVLSACGSSASPGPDDSTSEALLHDDVGADPAPVPSSCEILPNAEVPAMKRVVFAHGTALTSCSTITLGSGYRWAGTYTFPGSPGFCTYTYLGKGAVDFAGLAAVLPTGTVLDRAACGTVVNGGNPSLNAFEISPEGSASCGGPCTPVGWAQSFVMRAVLPLGQVRAADKLLYFITAGGTHTIQANLPPNTQLLSGPIAHPNELPYASELFVAEIAFVPPGRGEL